MGQHAQESTITVDNKYDHWQDDEGVLYHFPNKYIRKVKEGEPFIYYRGKRRANRKTGTPEYFGCGKIGKVLQDPLTENSPKIKRHWYCEILDYIPFKNTVPFKIGNNIYFENIYQNQWSEGVRNISLDVYKAILNQASIELVDEEVIIKPNSPNLPKIEEVTPSIVTDQDSLIYLPQAKKERRGILTDNYSYNRYSKYSKLYGDRAEEIIHQHLAQKKVNKLRWVAKENDKPGWDIEYYDDQNLIAVEVKGTSGKRFPSIDITAGEWEAAQKMGVNYNLYLVADCLGKNPKIQVINNPFRLFTENKIILKPLTFRLQINGDI